MPQPGAHVCAFFHDQERRAEILDAFVAEALEAGDKCYCLLEGPHPKAAEFPAAEYLTTAETYLADGRFSADAMLQRLERLVTRAVREEGYPGVRAVGEMAWAGDRCSGAEEVGWYESEVNRFRPDHRQVLLCLYDLTRFPTGALDQVLGTHPWILVADVVLPNPYFPESDLRPTC
ncbi:MAG: MEDS domain-containing protein [Actinomycetota bacterium]